MRSVRLLALLIVLSLGGCGILTGPDAASTGTGISAVARRGELVLRNGSRTRVHFVAVEEETAPLVDLFVPPSEWPHVEAGSEIRVPYPEVLGYTAGASWALVWLWSAEGGHQSPLRVRLR